MIWAVAVLFCALLVAAIVLPIVSKRNIDAGVSTSLADRLSAIERDRAAELIGEVEAAEAVIEIKRAALSSEGPRRDAMTSKPARLAAFAFAGLAPLMGAVIYLGVGAPELIGTEAPPPEPQSIAEMAPDQQAAAIRGMVEGLAARLAQNPEDADGWRMLARSYAALGDPAKSADALRELLARVEGDAEDWRAFAGALMNAGPGEGRAAELARALGKLKGFDPDDPMALYFEGEAARADGDLATAILRWRRLLEVLPPDAPVRPAIEKLIAEAEAAQALP